MNKSIYICIYTAMLLFSNCNVLNTKDLENYTPNDVWNDTKLANAYLVNLYADAFKGWPLNNGNLADECLGIITQNYVQTTNDNFKSWPYSQIRNINLMLENLPKGNISLEEQELLIGQAHFLRAWHYFDALRLHGGIPIIKEVQKATDDLHVKRNTSLECFNFIIEDLNEAAQMLPIKYSDANYGRIDQCIIAAFKGRVLLHKVSPQFNPKNSYDNGYIDEAYEATKYAKELLEQNGYGLVDSYVDIFETEGHREAVLPVIYKAPSKTSIREAHVRPLSESKNYTGGDQPTWGLIEAYPMKDGKKIGASSKYDYDLQTYWKDRDPRFDATIVYNGSVYELSRKPGRRQYTTAHLADSKDAFGKDLIGESYTRGGLFCKKGVMENLLATEVEQNDVDWLEIRYAEVLFNYAEMANEKGFQAIGYDVIKEIRNRAGIEAGTDGMYGLLLGMDKTEMRQAILDEKRIEFTFEGQRFWDLRRHRLLHSYLNGQQKYGVLALYKNSDGTNDLTNEVKKLASEYKLLPDNFVYSIEDVITFYTPNAENKMYTPESYYFFPIAKDEIDKNSNLEQNENWGGSFKGELQYK